MRKLYPVRILALTACFFFFGKINLIAQINQAASSGDIYSPPSPNASALLKYANVPVDEHAGIASVVLPIDKLSGRQLSVPVTLSYHGSGNKVQDLASNVGLGFVLNSGGVITRVMRGLPDESAHGYQYYGTKVSSNSIDSAYLNATMNNNIDGEPDMFYFNFLGHTGKMVIDTLGNAQYLPDQGIRVIRHPIHNNPDSTNNSWVLKDLYGVTYEFGSDTSARETTVVNLAGKPLNQAITYISSWYLKKITTADGAETMNFTYTSGPNMNYEQYRKVLTYNIHYYCVDKRKGLFSSAISHKETLSVVNADTTDISTVIEVLSPKYLSGIYNDMGSITFSYSARQDVSGGESLYQIKVFNIYDAATPLRTFTFNESYFFSPNPNSATDPDSQRLRLDCVTLQGRSSEIKQLYSFAYNLQTLLPPRNSNDFDHWGYYTTLDKRGGAPSTNVTQDKYGNYVEGFEMRVPDSSRMQACILTRVRNLNGGYTAFAYEANTYKYDGVSYFGGGIRIKTITELDSLGQVIPIVTKYSYQADNGETSGMIFNPKPYYIQNITNYQAGTVVKPIPSLLSYEINNLKKPLTIISTSAEVAIALAAPELDVAGLVIDFGITILAPAVADVFQFLFHRTHVYHYDSPPFSVSSTPLNNLFDINGASVTYSQVTKTNGDGGYTMNYYTSQQEYPDSASAVQLNIHAEQIKTKFGNSGSYPPNTSFDFERGFLKQSKLFDNNNNLVSQVTNTYQKSKRISVVSGQRSSVSGYAALANGNFQVITYNVGIYREIAENIQLVRSTTQIYDQNLSGAAITATNSYTWQPSYPTLVHSQSTLRSDGKMLVGYTSYPTDYAAGTAFIDDMVRHNMNAVPIESVLTLQDSTGNISVTNAMIHHFKAGGLGLLDTVYSWTTSVPVPVSGFKFSNHAAGSIAGASTVFGKDSRYIAKSFYQSYDSKNNLVQSQNLGEPSSSVIWGYHQDQPIAQISNAMISQVAYTGFETNDQRFWTFAAAGRDSSGQAKTGKIRYQLGSGPVNTTAQLPAGTYILSLWTQGAKPGISGTTNDVSIVNGESDSNSWNFYMDRITLSANATVTLTGSGLIDEVRLYPQGAHMSTMAMIPQVGVLTTTSKDDKVNSYEYDALNRLVTERDDQYNILKQYSYSNIPPAPCATSSDSWIGVSPVCFTDQTNVKPTVSNYSSTATNSYGTILTAFSRTKAETGYQAKINFTVSFSDNTTYSSSASIIKNGTSTVIGLPLTGKSAESVTNIGIDSIINLTDDYGAAYQKFQNRERTRDSYIESNTITGGIGPYIAPIRTNGCPTAFTNRAQTGFARNNCTTGGGSTVSYVVPAGTYSASTQAAADSLAMVNGQAYANANGTCTASDTSFMGTNVTCITGSTDSGTPTLSAYAVLFNYVPEVGIAAATLTRTSAEAAHDAIITYQISFADGTSATYTVPMYKNQLSINLSLPLTGYAIASVKGVSVTGAVYNGLKRRFYTTRVRYINGVADGYSEPNSTGTYYLAALEDPGACSTWYYNVAQTGFLRNNCTGGNPGLPFSYTVAAHSDSSMVSQMYADALSRARGQAYVNAAGSCYINSGGYATTFAGNGQSGYINGAPHFAEFSQPQFCAIDLNQNIYVVDGIHASKIRKVTPDGHVSTLAGSDTVGMVDGVGAVAKFGSINGMCTDSYGNIYVCDTYVHTIRKITSSGVVSTFDNNSGKGYLNVNNVNISIGSSNSGNIYIWDVHNNIIRRISASGAGATFAGNGTNGYVDGPVNSAEFSNISSFAIDNNGTVYILDNNRIRKISNGVVSTLAGDGSLWGFKDGHGTAVKFGQLSSITVDQSGYLYAGDIGDNCIRKISPSGDVTTITAYNLTYQGNNQPVDGPVFNPSVIYRAYSIIIDSSGSLYFIDFPHPALRKITFPSN
ncbi:DUF5977 domain-containing protein [Mucilaginibacter sp.]|uniref:DUF5977 domain-containing protein n=1 Tax=Mucilaginibacter sp. TaxID=1882438 RepID=UPI003D122908